MFWVGQGACVSMWVWAGSELGFFVYLVFFFGRVLFAWFKNYLTLNQEIVKTKHHKNGLNGG